MLSIALGEWDKFFYESFLLMKTEKGYVNLLYDSLRGT